MDAAASVSTLRAALEPRLEPAARTWLAASIDRVTTAPDPDALLIAYAGATRRLGRDALGTEGGRCLGEVPLGHWGVDEVGRALLLLAVREAVPDGERYAQLVRRCYDEGTAREQQSWLRGLAILPESERFVEIATDACRTNVVPLFESIACENPYPARHFPERAFNQLVLKSLFNGIALARIVGLTDRLNPELSRMANDYVSEREAAGRTVPADIWVVVAPHVAAPGLERALQYLGHDDPDHRYWAAGALRGRAGGADALARRRDVEPDPRVLAALDGVPADPS